MSDPLRTDPSRSSGDGAESDRDAKIEQLLLVGLDHYFAAQYEQAINVWTRALFLDRTHDRARAYIERARSALAERQRESEELLQTGVAAFHRGESGEARRLLQAAISRGAPSDEALSVLERLDRLESPAAGTPAQEPARSRRRRTVPEQSAPGQKAGRRIAPFVWSAVVIVIAIAGGLLTISTPAGWEAVTPLPQEQPSGPLPQRPVDSGLPLPRRGESALMRARGLAASGHLRDALAALDLIRHTDPEKKDADRLRADIQRQLIQLSARPPSDQETSAR